MTERRRVLDVFADTLREETALSERAISRIADKLLIGVAVAGYRLMEPIDEAGENDGISW